MQKLGSLFLAGVLLTAIVLKAELAFSAPQDEEEVEEVGNINPARTGRIETRIKSFRAWSFGLGPGTSNNLNNTEMLYTVSIGRHWEANENSEIRARLNLASAKKGTGALGSLGLGGAYFFSRKAFSPFVGGEFGIASAVGEDISAKTGFGGSLIGGLRFFRTSDTQMEIGGFYTQVFEKDSPGAYGVQLSILFQ